MLEGLKLTDSRSQLTSSLSNDRSSLLRVRSRREWDRGCEHRRSTAIRTVSFTHFMANHGSLVASTRMSRVQHLLPLCNLTSIRLSDFGNQFEGSRLNRESVGTYTLGLCLESS